MNSGTGALYVGSNLKMYKDVGQTLEFFRALDSLTADMQGGDLCLFVMAAYPALYTVSTALPKLHVRLGAQDVYWEEHGPFTGAVSPAMLKECGVQVVQIGHSERREYFGETNSGVNKKVHASLKHGLTALVCVGETAQEKSWGISIERVREQTRIALHGVTAAEMERVWIAYEPAWAIGPRGTPATPEYAAVMHHALRQVLVEISADSGPHMPILYGGSVDGRNAPEFIAQPEVDGVYVGRAAYDPKDFNALIREVRQVWLSRRKRP